MVERERQPSASSGFKSEEEQPPSQQRTEKRSADLMAGLRQIRNEAADPEQAASTIAALAGFDQIGLAEQEKMLLRLARDERLAGVITALMPDDHERYLTPFFTHFVGPIHPAMMDVLKTVFDNSPDACKETLLGAFRVRFQVNISDIDEPEALRRSWKVLEELPPAHVAGNKNFRSYRHEKGGGGGAYEEKIGEVSLRNFLESPQFDRNIRHEMGHAVDLTIGASNTYCKTPAGGGWRQWHEEPTPEAPKKPKPHKIDKAAVRKIMSGGSIPDRAAWDRENEWMVGALAHILDEERDQRAVYRTLERCDWWEKFTAEQKAKLGEIITKALPIDTHPTHPNAEVLGPSSTLGWEFHDLEKPIGGRFYSNGWTYLAAARERKVSNYQFYSPKEWFAEAYAAYYEPDPRGYGARLADCDPETKRWFDEHVHRAKRTRLPGERPRVASEADGNQKK